MRKATQFPAWLYELDRIVEVSSEGNLSPRLVASLMQLCSRAPVKPRPFCVR
jgi:hypothetical protein